MSAIVTKSNYLIEAGYKLSLNEQRLILLVISKLNSRTYFPKDNLFTVTAADFAEVFNIPLNQAYEALEDATLHLYEKDIKTFDNKAKERFRWVDKVKYCKGEAKVILSFTRWVTPYLSLLCERFTSYELKQVSSLKSAYSIRIYEFLVQFLITGGRFITLTNLREMLEIKEGYKRFFDIKRFIIQPSIDDINKTTDLTVNWNITKNGKRIIGLVFFFEKKDQKNITRELQDEKRKPIGVPLLPKSAYYQAKKVAPGMNIYDLEKEWFNWMIKKKPPNNPAGSFVGFCRFKYESNI